MARKRIPIWFLMMLFVALPQAAAPGQQGAKRDISRIKGDLYRFRNGGHFSVFRVTPAGIIATDPINEEAARWRKCWLDRWGGEFDGRARDLIGASGLRFSLVGIMMAGTDDSGRRRCRMHRVAAPIRGFFYAI